MTVSPLYTIHRFRADIFKVVAFKRRSGLGDTVFLHDREDDNHNDTKLDNNFSRARSMVLQYALCNPWTYFFTGTLDKAKYDRFDLTTYMGDLSQWIRDKRKVYNAKFQVLLVPEGHEDGAWHIHGLIYGLPASVLTPFWCLRQQGVRVPDKLLNGGFFNWPDYQAKFGYCSMAPIRDPIATAFYISKYVSKDLSRRTGDLGKHLYFHSRPLCKAEKVSDIYLPNPGLDDLCTHEYDFCKTGMVFDAPWYFPGIWDGDDVPMAWSDTDLVADPLDGFDPETVEPPKEVWEQMSFWA